MVAKLFVICAKREPIAVILRRGPSAWYHVIQWNTRRDSFVHGAWIKGRIYEEKCDVSPDGRLLLYFIHQGSRAGTEFTDSWTAISRVPWLKALVVWPQGTTYGGGGRFDNSSTITLRGAGPPLPDYQPRAFKVINTASPPVHCSTDEVPDADWCGHDHDGRVIYTRADQLFRREKNHDTLVADFTDLTPNPQPAPDWASKLQ